MSDFCKIEIPEARLKIKYLLDHGWHHLIFSTKDLFKATTEIALK
jgi:hypothetical protein